MNIASGVRSALSGLAEYISKVWLEVSGRNTVGGIRQYLYLEGLGEEARQKRVSFLASRPDVYEAVCSGLESRVYRKAKRLGPISPPERRPQVAGEPKKAPPLTPEPQKLPESPSTVSTPEGMSLEEALTRGVRPIKVPPRPVA